MRVRAFAAAMLVALLVLLVPMASQASHCQSAIIVYSSPPGVYLNQVACLVAGQEMDQAGVDGRLLWPGATDILVRYTVDQGVTTPTLAAVVNGLGFQDQQVTLTRVDAGFGIFFYDSQPLPIPAGPMVMGCITASIAQVEDTTTFAHPGQTCA